MLGLLDGDALCGPPCAAQLLASPEKLSGLPTHHQGLPGFAPLACLIDRLRPAADSVVELLLCGLLKYCATLSRLLPSA